MAARQHYGKTPHSSYAGNRQTGRHSDHNDGFWNCLNTAPQFVISLDCFVSYLDAEAPLRRTSFKLARRLSG
jgi:hypothetical protein